MGFFSSLIPSHSQWILDARHRQTAHCPGEGFVWEKESKVCTEHQPAAEETGGSSGTAAVTAHTAACFLVHIHLVSLFLKTMCFRCMTYILYLRIQDI